MPSSVSFQMSQIYILINAKKYQLHYKSSPWKMYIKDEKMKFLTDNYTNNPTIIETKVQP